MFDSDHLYHRPEVYHAAHPDSNLLGSVLRRWLRPPVLDLGCGTGRQWQDFPECSVGVDIHDAMLQSFRRRHPNRKVVQADFSALPFESNAFQTITILMNTCVHVATVAAFSELARCLTPNGRILVETCDIQNGAIETTDGIFNVHPQISVSEFFVALRLKGGSRQWAMRLGTGFQISLFLV